MKYFVYVITLNFKHRGAWDRYSKARSPKAKETIAQRGSVTCWVTQLIELESGCSSPSRKPVFSPWQPSVHPTLPQWSAFKKPSLGGKGRNAANSKTNYAKISAVKERSGWDERGKEGWDGWERKGGHGAWQGSSGKWGAACFAGDTVSFPEAGRSCTPRVLQSSKHGYCWRIPQTCRTVTISRKEISSCRCRFSIFPVLLHMFKFTNMKESQAFHECL